MSCSKVIGIIPARYKSSRFPGKVLSNILGKSLVQRTYENVIRSKLLDEVVVAVDDKQVMDHVLEFGGKAIMTPPDCESGTARAAFVMKDHFLDASIVVNIQADEPCLSHHIIDALVNDLCLNPEAVMTTPVVQIFDTKQLFSPSSAKCVFDTKKRALYFSRAPIPYPQKEHNLTPYYRHVGAYCFRKDFLLKFADLSSTCLREVEDLEQLKILEHGYPVYVSIVEYSGVEVNHPEDIQKVEEYLCSKENTSLLPVG